MKLDNTGNYFDGTRFDVPTYPLGRAEHCSVFRCYAEPHEDSEDGMCAVHEVEAAWNLDSDQPMTPAEIERCRFWIGELTDEERKEFLEGAMPC